MAELCLPLLIQTVVIQILSLYLCVSMLKYFPIDIQLEESIFYYQTNLHSVLFYYQILSPYLCLCTCVSVGLRQYPTCILCRSIISNNLTHLLTLMPASQKHHESQHQQELCCSCYTRHSESIFGFNGKLLAIRCFYLLIQVKAASV